SVMYGDGGPPGNQGKAPTEVCIFCSERRATSRCSPASLGSSTLSSSASCCPPPCACSSQGVSSSSSFRFGSGASHCSSRVFRVESVLAICPTSGCCAYRLETIPVETKRFSVCSVHSYG